LARILDVTGAIWSHKTQLALREAAALISAGKLVAIPTETVYGLAADATSDQACAHIFEAKERPRFNPLISHVADYATAARHAHFDPIADRLANAFWPGPLTLVLKRKQSSPVCDLVTAGLPSVALRVPDSPVVQELSRICDVPLAAPSANRSGRISTTSTADVVRELGDSVDLILDAGPTRIGLESTIVAVNGDQVRLLRPGGIPTSEIEALIGAAVMRPDETPTDQPQAPGMLASHYAPGAGLRMNATTVAAGEALLAFNDQNIGNRDAAIAVRNLSPSGNTTEAAANLFRFLRELDGHKPQMIAVETIPDDGLGEAINDRLRRAAAPRP